MTWKLILVAMVTAQRVTELVLAQCHTHRLLRQGGVEYGKRHYPLIVLFHGLWLVFLIYKALQPGRLILWPVGLFLLLQPLRLWAIVTLGRYWTTRIISVPTAPLVKQGPYRYLRHPNYLVVALEVPLLPLAFDAAYWALAFGLINVALLIWRIKIEEAALSLRHDR